MAKTFAKWNPIERWKSTGKLERDAGLDLQWSCAKKIYYGCPVGNLVIELSALDEDFRKPLEQLFSDLQKKIAENLSALTGLLVKQNLPAAHAIIAQIQGSLLLLKVTQDLNVLESNFDLLKTSFEKVGEK